MLRSAEEVAEMHIGHALQLHVASTTRLLQTTMNEAKSSERAPGVICSPPAYAKHLARAPFVKSPRFRILKPSAFVARNVESQVVILEITFVTAFRHVDVDGACGQGTTDVEVHSHVCRSDTIGFRFGSIDACQLAP